MFREQEERAAAEAFHQFADKASGRLEQKGQRLALRFVDCHDDQGNLPERTPEQLEGGMDIHEFTDTVLNFFSESRLRWKENSDFVDCETKAHRENFDKHDANKDGLLNP